MEFIGPIIVVIVAMVLVGVILFWPRPAGGRMTPTRLAMIEADRKRAEAEKQEGEAVSTEELRRIAKAIGNLPDER